MIRANGIANGTFMVVPNRIGTEGPITFYGSSFISDPYGRVLVQAPRDEPAVLVADLDLDQRRDWLDLFPFLRTRRPSTYGPLLDEMPSGNRFCRADRRAHRVHGVRWRRRAPATARRRRDRSKPATSSSYRCPDCGQRWDVVVDEDDSMLDDGDDNR